MFRRSDFRKLELFGGGKKNTKVFKVEHIRTGEIFALKVHQLIIYIYIHITITRINHLLHISSCLYSLNKIKTH